MPAEEALEAGLVNKVYESHEEMVAGIKEMATVIASKSPLAVYGTKAILNFSRDHTIAEGLEYNAPLEWSYVAAGRYGRSNDVKYGKKRS